MQCSGLEVPRPVHRGLRLHRFVQVRLGDRLLRILLVVRYGLALDLLVSIAARFLTSLVAVGIGALAISSVQLLVGDALLPRFVVFGSALLIIPWSTFCVGLSSIGHEASGDRTLSSSVMTIWAS